MASDKFHQKEDNTQNRTHHNTTDPKQKENNKLIVT